MKLKWQEYVEENKSILLGKPVLKGTRLPVELILRELGNGMSQEELLNCYPTLTPEHIRASLLYAAAVVTMDESIYE